MPSEFKPVINVRISSEMNVSFATSHVGLATTDEADRAGEEDARMMLAYIEGFSRINTEDEG